MLTAIPTRRNPLRKSLRAVAALAFVALAACQPIGPMGGQGPRVGAGQTVEVAMLLPISSPQGGDSLVARSLENAARLAAAETAGVTVDITVYDTAGQAAQAASVARQAVAAGADVIVGPLRSDAAAAVGVAVAGSNIAVLSFSNNTEIAGGNVFVLGHTFATTADRIVRYAASQGRDQLVLVHSDTLAGEVARDSVLRASGSSGATVTATVAHEFSQNGVVAAIPGIAQQVRDSGATGIVLAADAAGALPLFAQLLPENGIDPSEVKMIGLTRWDTPPQTLELRGLQGGWFALPDPASTADFTARYRAAHGTEPHILAALGYDAIRAVADTAAGGGRVGFAALAGGQEFDGANGAFRLNPDGTNLRALAIASVIDNQVAVIDPAPRRLGGFGF